VVIVGRVTRDPELQYTESSGTPLTNLCMAVSRNVTNADGSSRKTVTFIDVVVWKAQAELCCTYLRKGSTLLVSGFLEIVRWTDSQGAVQSQLRVRAQRIQFMDKKAKPAAEAPTEPL
jgi:single-strand DNA-binding protein